MSKRITNRFNKFVIMFIMILAGISYASLAEAAPPKSKSSKNSYHASRKGTSGKACYILHKKRVNQKNIYVSVKRAKARPMAETDSPYMSVASSN